MRLDQRSSFPSGMEEYLSYYGWHFSKKMCEWATSMMYKKEGEKFNPYTKEQVQSIFKTSNINVEVTYDVVYLANMVKADFLGSSIIDEIHLAKYVENVVKDPDGYDDMPFTRFYADCIGSGKGINWEDMI